MFSSKWLGGLRPPALDFRRQHHRPRFFARPRLFKKILKGSLLGAFLLMSQAFASSFTLESPSFSQHGIVQKTCTCEGVNRSPAVRWSGTPENTKSFALVMQDPDAPLGLWIHWFIYNLPATTSSLSENATDLPKKAFVGANSWERRRYDGPCPPRGATHHYEIVLYALDATLTLPERTGYRELQMAMKGHVLASTQITATYQR
jgi:hypothetical protein